jgi:hypothetical protein
LGDAQGDHLGIGDPPAGVGGAVGQEIVGRANRDAEVSRSASIVASGQTVF